MDRLPADAAAEAPAGVPRAAALVLGVAAALGAVLLALDVANAYADPETYRAVYHMDSDEAVFRSVGHYAAVTGALALGCAGVAVLAVASARTGRWRRTLWGAAVALAGAFAWSAV